MGSKTGHLLFSKATRKERIFYTKLRRIRVLTFELASSFQITMHSNTHTYAEHINTQHKHRTEFSLHHLPPPALYSYASSTNCLKTEHICMSVMFMPSYTQTHVHNHRSSSNTHNTNTALNSVSISFHLLTCIPCYLYTTQRPLVTGDPCGTPHAHPRDI